MDADELRLLLARAPGLTATALRTAVSGLAQVEALLGPGAALRAGTAADTQPLPAATLRWLAAPDRALLATDRDWLRREQIVLIDCFGGGYPPLLAAIADAPPVLFVRGRPQALLEPQIAMVGSRNPTPAGRRTALAFAHDFVRSGLTITSGLALGIDAAAHEGTLAAGGCTVAALAAGLDRVYPPQHLDLALRIAAAGGAVISEFPPGTPPRREHFPYRNRLISGLSLGTLVVEAAQRSGSLITARLAGEQGREVFAIPGSIHNLMTRGCHALIRSGAKLVESTADVLSELQFPYVKQVVNKNHSRAVALASRSCGLDNDYKILLDALGFEPTGVDALVDRTGFPSQSVVSMLLILELEGRVGVHAGGRYMRLDQERDG